MDWPFFHGVAHRVMDIPSTPARPPVTTHFTLGPSGSTAILSTLILFPVLATARIASWCRILPGLAICLVAALNCCGTASGQATTDTARSLFYEGKYSEVLLAATAAIGESVFSSEDWIALQAEAQIATGDYASAKQTIDAGLEQFPYSVQLRWTGANVHDYNNDLTRALELKAEIGGLWTDSPWRYRNSRDLVIVGRYMLERRVDAKKVLDEFFARARDQNPSLAASWMAIGDLALEKNDFALAATNFAKAAELDRGNPDCHLGLALAYQPNLPEKAAESLNRALEINPEHIGSLLVIVERQISAEDYAGAETNIQKILKVNPERFEAWSYRAVLAHLNNDAAEEGRCRTRALKHWEHNGLVDHIIGRELSKKYRFAEGSEYQRMALLYEPGLLTAKIQLAHDLLRLGQELEGWKLAEEVFDADQYNVVANNLVELRDNLSQFATIERNGFVVRMDRVEAEVYGELVLELLEKESQQLVGKYGVQLQTPIFIEIFPRQQDFAIRTFGLPGGAGFLGVCFGRVVTMNSPAAQGASLTNWRSVLWHEFCHVVTLQKTNNRMPRWLSEGISVYEEQLADPAWGDTMTPRYREMILGGELTPVSKLSSAFLSPPSGEHLRFAYYESSLVVRFLVEQFGQAAMVALLDDLATGTPINDALRRHAAPVDFLDKKFEEYATRLANELAPAADWTKPGNPVAGVEGWQEWLDGHPDNIYGLLGLAGSQVEAGDLEAALETIGRFDSIYPETKGAETAWALKAEIHRSQNDIAAETAALERLTALDADDVAACVRLIEIHSAAGNWADVERVSDRLQGINPMLKSAHRSMALAAEQTANDPLAIRALSALVSLGPFDRADTHYRLASALFRGHQLDLAKRNVLLALAAAPRYRAAHQLLLEIVKMDEEKKKETESDSNGAALPADANRGVTR